ncbi:unnamed protein product [Caenorhabditis angaria]|uniref:Uncharacterized protein n=1 Tax=Caenorhabditis angaria TaxID=860376 RepID=A0A9P1I771_9PELO|nr:unnamed protein product [Caenorhabditis angaria]
MPLSTGSIDSGFIKSMTDEELSSSASSFTSSSLKSTNVQKKTRIRSRKNQRNYHRHNNHMNNTNNKLSSSSSSSCCSNSIAGTSENSWNCLKNASVEELAIRVYLYFKSLLLAVNKQRQICENIAVLMSDIDARWGYSPTDRKGNRKYLDPRGCLAPIYNNNDGKFCQCEKERCGCRLVKSARFPACWAVPQPAVFYHLMANDIQEYLRFLEKINPNVKNQLHEHQQQNPHVQNQHQMTHEEVLFSIQNLQMQGAQVMHPGMMPYYTGHPYSKYSGSEETSSNGSTPFKGARQDQQNHVAPPPPTPSSQNNAQNHLEINDESGRKLDIKPLMEEYEQPNKVGYQNRGTTSRNSENSDNG